MRGRELALLIASAFATPLAAQQAVVSPGPDKVALTVYRSPAGGEMNLDWLDGFAMISETRHVSLPAGESELRFEGVAGGLIPQSVVVSGLGKAVSEKNRDAKLLSPGTLLDAFLGRRVQLRRTSLATGAVREQEAVVRASGDGVVIETDQGIEALRCTGLAETLLTPNVPPTLSAKPTLSVKVGADRPVEADVKLTYLTSGFDWRAHYVATLSPDERSLSLFAWLTLANGDETGFRDANTMAVAGRLNREEVERLQPEARPIQITCWPSQRTDEVPLEQPPLYAPPPPPPPPPPPAPERGGGEEIVVTGSSVMAQREALGDLKLYRIPIPVTVASHSQKQVALLEQPAVKFESFYRWQSGFGGEANGAAVQRILKMENRKAAGLGLPLPAGGFTLYTKRGDRPFLLGEGQMTDRAEGETVEVALDNAPGISVVQRQLERTQGEATTELVVTNDQPRPIRFEARFAEDRRAKSSSAPLVRRDGSWWWTTRVPANGTASLTIRYAAD
jgi:hypothetical protein